MIALEIKERLEAHAIAEQITSATLCRDALQLVLNNGVILMLCFVSAEEYSMSWRWGDVEMRIDTAPTHPSLSNTPNHLHLTNGEVVVDTVSHVGAPPWDNALHLIEHLLNSPFLEHEASSVDYEINDFTTP